MISDVLVPLVLWWLAVTAIGWAAVPVAHWLLPALPDRGFTLARPIGLVLLGYGYWIAGLSGLLPNSRLGAYVALGLFLGASSWVAWQRRVELVAFLRQRKRYVLGAEALFLIVLTVWALYRAYVPGIEPAGGEKYMEMAFINAILRSPSFPPNDPWLGGFAISYYYFGYLISALLVQITGLQSSIAFNLVIPMTLAMTCVGAFGLGHSMVALAPRSSRALRVAGGALAAVMLPLAGSLVGLVELGFMQGWGAERLYAFLEIKDLTPGGVCNTSGSGFGVGGLVPSRFMWWWRGSRVIHDACGEVIHEFPFFSFMLGDVHPHVLALPYVLVALGIGLAVLAGLLDGAWRDRPSPRVVLMALLVGALGFLNTWDLPTFGAVVVAAYGFRVAAMAPPVVRPSRWDAAAGAISLVALFGLAWRYVPLGLEAVRGVPPDQQPVVAKLSLSLAIALAVVAVAYTVLMRAVDGAASSRQAIGWLRFAFWFTAVAVAAYAPFYIGFHSQASGFGTSAMQTRPVQWLVHFGPLLFLAVSLVVGWFPVARRASVRWPAWLALAAATGVAAYALVRGALTPAVIAIAAGAAGFTAVQAWVSRRTVAPAEASPAPPERTEDAPEEDSTLRVGATFALGCVGLGLLLALVPEFVFVRDLFGSRMNTVFKLFYQAWVLLAIGGSYALFTIFSRYGKTARFVWGAGAGLLVAASLIYPLQAVYTRTDGLAVRPLTLDGLAAWEQGYPDDLAAARWLRANAAPGAVLVEAYGGAYEHNGRVSMATGIPAVLGWEGHEHQWRGTREDIDPRKVDVEKIYTTRDEDERSELLDRHRVRYVVLSDAERTKFALSAAQVEALEEALPTVFVSPSGRLRVFEVR